MLESEMLQWPQVYDDDLRSWKDNTVITTEVRSNLGTGHCYIPSLQFGFHKFGREEFQNLKFIIKREDRNPKSLRLRCENTARSEWSRTVIIDQEDEIDQGSITYFQEDGVILTITFVNVQILRNDITEGQHVNVPKKPSNIIGNVGDHFDVVCPGCANTLNITQFKVKRILPLPSSHWKEFAQNWFCGCGHNTDDGKLSKKAEASESSSIKSLPAKLLQPQASDILYRPGFIVISENLYGLSAFLEDTYGILTCNDCKNEIGYRDKENDTVNLWEHAVVAKSRELSMDGLPTRFIWNKTDSVDTFLKCVFAALEETHFVVRPRLMCHERGEGNRAILLRIWEKRLKRLEQQRRRLYSTMCVKAQFFIDSDCTSMTSTTQKWKTEDPDIYAFAASTSMFTEALEYLKDNAVKPQCVDREGFEFTILNHLQDGRRPERPIPGEPQDIELRDIQFW